MQRKKKISAKNIWCNIYKYYICRCRTRIVKYFIMHKKMRKIKKRMLKRMEMESVHMGRTRMKNKGTNYIYVARSRMRTLFVEQEWRRNLMKGNSHRTKVILQILLLYIIILASERSNQSRNLYIVVSR
jgi:hypothetical protein